MLLAAFAGGLAGVVVLLRTYWYRILGVFSKKYRLKAEINQGELLGIDIDPETGQPTDPDAAADVLSGDRGDASTDR